MSDQTPPPRPPRYSTVFGPNPTGSQTPTGSKAPATGSEAHASGSQASPPRYSTVFGPTPPRPPERIKPALSTHVEDDEEIDADIYENVMEPSLPRYSTVFGKDQKVKSDGGAKMQ